MKKSIVTMLLFVSMNSQAGGYVDLIKTSEDALKVEGYLYDWQGYGLKLDYTQDQQGFKSTQGTVYVPLAKHLRVGGGVSDCNLCDNQTAFVSVGVTW